MNLFKKNIIIFLNLFFISFTAFASIGLNQTRIVIDGSQNSASIEARNTDDFSYLVVNYITEKPNANPVDNNFFIITPQVFKLDENSTNTIKIQAIPNSFPTDRESMYYFHSRNVPATDKKAGVKIGLENIIKVFYRPASLTMDSKDAYAALEFKYQNNGISVINDSPYFINLHKLNINNELIKLTADNNVIAPYSKTFYTTKNRLGLVKWFVVNELGGIDEFSKNI